MIFWNRLLKKVRTGVCNAQKRGKDAVVLEKGRFGEKRIVRDLQCQEIVWDYLNKQINKQTPSFGPCAPFIILNHDSNYLQSTRAQGKSESCIDSNDDTKNG